MYGEMEDIVEEIETFAWINAKRSKIVSEKHGIMETIVYEAMIPPHISVSEEDKVEWQGEEYEIRQILPVHDIYGRQILLQLNLQKKD